MNFQRCKHVFHQYQYKENCNLPSVSYCWWSFSSTISHLLSLLQSVTLACSLDEAPVCHMLFCTIVLFKVLYSKIKNVFFIFCLFFMYYLCEKYYKPIRVQYFIADCVSSVSRLTVGLTNCTYECALRMELICV